ncbi:MAG: TonB family protein [Acidobacteriota bacterium]
MNPSKLIMPGLVVTLALALGLTALALAAGSPESSGGFIVVVNADNPTGALPAAEIAQMFLQKTPQWTSGAKVMAVDLTEDSAARQAFSKAILDRSTAAVKAYWQTMIFSGRAVPPPEKPTAAEILSYVRANPGGIGYLASGTALADGVKLLRVLASGSAASEPAGGAEEVLDVEGDVIKPEAISRKDPVYPDAARRARIEGTVTLEATIDKRGKVTGARVLASLPMGLDRAAVDALMKWKFKPATRSGQPVNVRYVVNITFTLQ